MRALYTPLVQDILFIIYIHILRAQHTTVVISCDNGGQHLRSRYNLPPGERIPQEVQTLHHGGQLCARATRAQFDPSTEDQGQAEQRRPAHQETKR